MTETDTTEATFAEWAILELMGHRRLAGYLTEQEIGGQSFLRLDVPGENGARKATQFYSASAVYCITPTSEETAKLVARGAKLGPVQRWELPAPDDDEDDEAPF